MSHQQFSYLFFMLMVSAISLAQKNQQQLFYGKFLSDGKSVAGIDVVNLVNEKATVSDSEGNFQIQAKAGDLLVISGKEFEYMRYSIDPEDLNEKSIMISLISKAIQLEESVVNRYSHINSRSLGIIPANQKVYTPAEAKLASAQSGPVDLIVNLINGKISQKKKEVEIEKKEFVIERLDILYPESFYVKHLRIPEDRIQGFKFFAADDAALTKSVDSKNKSLIEFELSRLANQYLKFE